MRGCLAVLIRTDVSPTNECICVHMCGFGALITHLSLYPCAPLWQAVASERRAPTNPFTPALLPCVCVIGGGFGA